MNIKLPWILGGIVLLALLTSGLLWMTAPRDVPVAEEKADSAPAAVAVAAAQPQACVQKGSFEVTADDFVIGDKNAPVTLVEFFSQTCSHCAAFRAEDFPKLEEAYIKKGLVRFVLRDFQRNNVDMAASVVGRCFKGGFVKFTDMLLENQPKWLERPDQDVRAGLKAMALDAGMTDEAFEACLKKESEAKQLLQRAVQAQKDYCLEGTPTFLLNGKKVEDGLTFEALDKQIKAALAAPKTEGAATPTP